MQNESQNIEYKESWGRGFKKIVEEFERASLPLPTIEENGGGVMAIVQRKTIDEVIAERDEDVGVNVSVNVGVNSREISDVKLTERQTIMVSVIKSNLMVTAKQMSETLSVTVRTIERDLALMQKAGIIRHEGSDKTGVWGILEQGNTNS